MGRPSSLLRRCSNLRTRGVVARALCQYAVVLLPETILVEATPYGVLLDMQDEVRLAFLEFDHIGFADADGIPARPHLSTIDLITIVLDGDVADHGASLLGEHMKLFAKSVERDLEILHPVGLALIVEGLLGALDRMQRHVHASEG